MLPSRKLSVVFVSALLAIVAGCGTSAPSTASPAATSTEHHGATIDKIRSDGTLIVGVADDTPWSFSSLSPQGDYGIMPDIIAQFAKMEGIPHVQYQSMLFADFIGALQSDRIDIVGDTMYNTIAREQEIAYPSPVFYDPGGMIVAKGNPLNLHSLSDLKSGMKLAVPEGSIYLTYAQNLVASGVQLTLLPVPGVSQQIAAVSSGQADAAINDAILYAYALKINPSLNLSIATPFAQPVVRSSTESDCTFPKGEPDLIAAWNADFNVMTKDGFVDKVLEEYGATPSLYVANPTDPDYTSS